MAPHAVQTQQPPSGATAECQHRWLIDTPNGPRVRGRCRRCGSERTYETTPEPLPWGNAFGTLKKSSVASRRGPGAKDQDGE